MPLPTPEKPVEWEVDRHKLWRRIAADFEELKALSCESYEKLRATDCSERRGDKRSRRAAGDRGLVRDVS